MKGIRKVVLYAYTLSSIDTLSPNLDWTMP